MIVRGCLLLALWGCGDDDAAEGATDPPHDGGHDAAPVALDAGSDAPLGAAVGTLVPGEFLALTYNVAGLPMGLSSSMPEIYTAMIGPLLNRYDVVLLQESWQTPDPNPQAPTRVYHEILVEASRHPYKSVPAEQPLGMDPDRPTALLGDGLNVFSVFPLGETTRVRWPTCVDSEADCLALKGFSMTRMDLSATAGVDVYDLHMEAGDTPEDDEARDAGIDELVQFIADHSEGRAILLGGDFNLHTDQEPAASQFARFLDGTQLHDACTELGCDRPGSIDKLLYRSSAEVQISAEELSFETEVFVTEDGEPLSDHAPLAVRFAWGEP